MALNDNTSNTSESQQWLIQFPSMVANRVGETKLRLEGQGPEKLKPGDNLVTAISKKVSWILRHGTHTLSGVEIDIDGFIRVKDLLTTPSLSPYDYETLISQIHISNEQKKRYDLKEENEDIWIRATREKPEKKKKENIREKPERGDREPGGKSRGKGGDNDRERSGVDFGNKFNSNGDRNVEDDRPPKGRGKQSQAAQRPPPDRTTWGQKPKDTSQVGKTWVVASNVQEVLVRDGMSTDSEVKYTIMPGQIVTQIGPDEDMQRQGWIVRMEISFTSPETNQVCTGWVTKTAEACQGPRFFYPSRPDRQSNNPSARDGADRNNQNGARNSQRWTDLREKGQERNEHIQHNPDFSDGDPDYRLGRNPQVTNPSSPTSPTNRQGAPNPASGQSADGALTQQAEERARYHDAGRGEAEGEGRKYPTSAQQFLGLDKTESSSINHYGSHNVDARGKWGKETMTMPRHPLDGKNHVPESQARYHQPSSQLPASGAADHWSRAGPHTTNINGSSSYQSISNVPSQMYHPQHGFPPQYAHLGYAYNTAQDAYNSKKGSKGGPGALGGGAYGQHYGAGGMKGVQALKGSNSKPNFAKGKGEGPGQFMGI